VRIVKAFGMEGYESGRFSEENERFANYRLKTIKVRAISSPLIEVLGTVGFAATIWYAAYRITSGTLKPEDFISFFAAAVMLYQPIRTLNGVHLNLQQGLAAATRVFEVMDTPGEPREEQAEELRGLTDSIEFKNVSFSYGNKTVLKEINLKVKKGSHIAIVGASGTGKTTFINLLPRFYDVTGGEILIDGKDIRELTLTSLRSNISVVSQQVVLFNDTIKGNIAYGDPERTDEEVIKAAVAANAHGFVKKLSHGYMSVIGESGVRFSGGERQRISIARAILKDAPILIMDEATSSLDTESEIEVQKGLANLMEGRTTFVIAHRLSTVRNADRIIVLAGGTIVEEGRHEELLRRGGEYARLHALHLYGMNDGMAT
jgi:subfamily B ATP-binding cassette protein MsbA